MKRLITSIVCTGVVAGALSVAPAWSAPNAGPAAAPGVDTWAAAPVDLNTTYTDRTVRNIVHTSIAGSGVRVRLSNAFGTGPVTFDSVYLGKQADGAALRNGSNRRVRFGGKNSVTVRKGAEVLSDPVPANIAAGTNLAVSVHVAGATGRVTGHRKAQQTSYYATGDTAAATSGAAYTHSFPDWYWLDGVVVDHPGATTLVALGDSITNGTASSLNTNHRWPDYLANRLRAAGGPRFGVADKGIGGNKVTADSTGAGVSAGPSALSRLQRDVLTQPNASTVIFLEGINDIGGGYVTSADQLIAADRKIIARAHRAGLRILGGTLTPFAGAGYYSAQKETIREAVNHWIRTSGAFDAVVDFDAAVRDPKHPHALLPAYDSGGHLHPNDAGYRAMARAVPLAALSPR